MELLFTDLMNTVYLTKKGYEKLLKELEILRIKGRREVAEKLKTAKELGDLSENSEYQEAREEQARLEQKIASLEEMIRTSSIIEKPKGGILVKIGSRVVLKRGDENITYTIVGSNETNPQKGLISNESPLGKAILGKRVGEEVVVKTPKRKNTYFVFEIN